MEKVSVVVGTCGEYSDRQEWVTRVFSSEIDAADFVALLEREWATKSAPLADDGHGFEEDSWDARQRAREQMAHLDPHIGYDEPTWSVVTAPFGPVAR